MEENTSLSTEQQTADQQEAFLEGWGDDSPEAEEPADQQDQQPEEQGSRRSEADSAAARDGNAEVTAGEGGDGQQEERKAPQTWNVKHMGQERTLGVADVTPELLQKGLDYDRIRGKYDEAKPVMEMFTQFAAQAKMSVSDYVKFIRTEAKKAGGMSEADAKKTVELEDREAAVSVQEAKQQADAKKQEDSKARIQADLTEFAKAFPDVNEQAKRDRTVIPKSVWDEVSAGMSLTAAYARYAVAQAKQAEAEAKARADTQAKNQTNASRSTGSMKSAGSDTRKKEAFLEGWDS